MSESELLKNAGQISHADAMKKADAEYHKYQERTKDELSSVEKDFLETIKKLKNS
jgi:hypothetical protein